jgi:hypothetical protein
MNTFVEIERITEFFLQSSRDTANSSISQAINHLKRETENWLYGNSHDSGFRAAIDVARQLERVVLANRLARGKFSRHTLAAIDTMARGVDRSLAPVNVQLAIQEARIILTGTAKEPNANTPVGLGSVFSSTIPPLTLDERPIVASPVKTVAAKALSARHQRLLRPQREPAKSAMKSPRRNHSSHRYANLRDLGMYLPAALLVTGILMLLAGFAFYLTDTNLGFLLVLL